MKRRYEELLNSHFRGNNQMAFVAGPRQVGKTTTCTSFSSSYRYFNWDNDNDRLLIISGPTALIDKVGLLDSLVLIFDELHKYAHWKNFIKGLYDSFGRNRFKIIVTGSARLDLYQKGNDSLMGRYFMYRMHPLSIGEIVRTDVIDSEYSQPQKIDDDDFVALRQFGGYPDPFIRRNTKFYNRWKKQRLQLLFREDIRDLTKIYEIGQVELLSEFLKQQSGQLINYASFSRRIRASEDSIRRWIGALESLYFSFSIRPWSTNISRSLLKNPKIYLWDWSLVGAEGSRNENFVASHLLKAVHWWQDCGFGEYGLHYIRTKDQREVDFLVTKNNQPWILVEVKTSDKKLNPNLAYFQERIGAAHAFQLAMDAEYVDVDCFQTTRPVRVPASTFLSQLI